MNYLAPPLARFRLYAILAGVWAVLILVLTLTPAKDMPRVPEWQLLSFDTAAHAFVFAVLAIPTYLAAQEQQLAPGLRQRPGLWVFTACVVFGATIEILQMLMQLGRHGEWTDLLSDSLGAIVGVLAAWAVWRSRR